METSVVIPTKNSVGTIKQCLSSLMPYYEKGYIKEIVVVDAHSTDGTLEIINAFPVKLIFDKGKGEYAARQLGWSDTNGELLLFIDNDAFVGKDFFPSAIEYFKDVKVGIVGIPAKAMVNNSLTRTIGEWWTYHTENLKGLMEKPQTSWSPLQRLYQKVVFGGEKQVVTSGPCYIVRRSCMEAVNGFYCHQWSEDICLSRRITEKGYKAVWWFGGEVSHYPPESFKKFIKQRYHWGKSDATMQRESLKTHQKIILLISRLATPVVGIRLAIRFRNPLHIILFPLAHYVWISGYIAEMTSRKSKRKS